MRLLKILAWAALTSLIFGFVLSYIGLSMTPGEWVLNDILRGTLGIAKYIFIPALILIGLLEFFHKKSR